MRSRKRQIFGGLGLNLVLHRRDQQVRFESGDAHLLGFLQQPHSIGIVQDVAVEGFANFAQKGPSVDGRGDLIDNSARGYGRLTRCVDGRLARRIEGLFGIGSFRDRTLDGTRRVYYMPPPRLWKSILRNRRRGIFRYDRSGCAASSGFVGMRFSKFVESGFTPSPGEPGEGEGHLNRVLAAAPRQRVSGTCACVAPRSFRVDRMKWIRRLFFCLMAAIALLFIAGGVGSRMLHGRPGWYKHDAIDPGQREQIAKHVEDKLTDATNWSQSAWSARQHPSAQQPPAPLEFSLTEEEINAFISKWADLSDSDARVAAVLSDPQVALDNGELTLAATMKELETVVSIHLTPRIDEKGLIHADIEKVMGGQLPLPQAIWDVYAKKLAAHIQSELPAAERNAKLRI